MLGYAQDQRELCKGQALRDLSTGGAEEKPLSSEQTPLYDHQVPNVRFLSCLEKMKKKKSFRCGIRAWYTHVCFMRPTNKKLKEWGLDPNKEFVGRPSDATTSDEKTEEEEMRKEGFLAAIDAETGEEEIIQDLTPDNLPSDDEEEEEDEDSDSTSNASTDSEEELCDWSEEEDEAEEAAKERRLCGGGFFDSMAGVERVPRKKTRLTPPTSPLTPPPSPPLPLNQFLPPPPSLSTLARPPISTLPSLSTLARPPAPSSSEEDPPSEEEEDEDDPKKKKKKKKFYFADFETCRVTAEKRRLVQHVPILLKVLGEEEGQEWTFEGRDCSEKFFQFIYKPENKELFKDSQIFFHNLAGFDGTYLLSFTTKKKTKSCRIHSDAFPRPEQDQSEDYPQQLPSDDHATPQVECSVHRLPSILLHLPQESPQSLPRQGGPEERVRGFLASKKVCAKPSSSGTFLTSSTPWNGTRRMGGIGVPCRLRSISRPNKCGRGRGRNFKSGKSFCQPFSFPHAFF